MSLRTIDQLDLKGKRVLLRAGFDVPIEDGEVRDTARIEAVLPTMKYILEEGAALIIMAHQGRPKGTVVDAMSQKPLVPVLEKLLGVSVQFAGACRGKETVTASAALKPGEVLLLENLRFDPGEKSKEVSERDALGKELAALADIYVNDAFTNCHRDHASMTSVPRYLPGGGIGFHVQKEVEHLGRAVEDQKRPVCLIISGSKIETKVPVIEQFLSNGDDILVGGCIANTLIAARGFDVAKSRYEEEFVELAQNLMLESEKEDKAMIHIPRDAVVATEASEEAEKLDLPVEDIGGDMAIFDIGKVTIERYIHTIEQSGTIVWVGPMGMYELNRFSHATKRIAEALKKATERGAVTIVGGGDTLGFHEIYDYPLDSYTFVSTAGGAMLDFISGKPLPALEALKEDT